MWEEEGRRGGADERSGVELGELGVEEEERTMFGVERDWWRRCLTLGGGGGA